jgi:hypothetical protein
MVNPGPRASRRLVASVAKGHSSRRKARASSSNRGRMACTAPEPLCPHRRQRTQTGSGSRLDRNSRSRGVIDKHSTAEPQSQQNGTVDRRLFREVETVGHGPQALANAGSRPLSGRTLTAYPRTVPDISEPGWGAWAIKRHLANCARKSLLRHDRIIRWCDASGATMTGAGLMRVRLSNHPNQSMCCAGGAYRLTLSRGHAAECVMPQRQQEASVTPAVMKSFQTSAQPGQTAASGCREGFVRHQQSSRTDEPKWHRQQQFEIGVYRRER